MSVYFAKTLLQKSLNQCALYLNYIFDGMNNSTNVFFAVSHEILPPQKLLFNKARMLALGVQPCRDLHYEQGLMKEWLRGGLGGFGS